MAAQTPEDGVSTRLPRQTVHGEGTVLEYVRTEIAVRLPPDLMHRRTRSVIRDYQATGETKAALEVLQRE